MQKAAFSTIANGGCQEGYSNACLFIAILDYIKYVLFRDDFSIKRLREESNFFGNRHAEFDFEDTDNKKGLEFMLQCYDLCMHFYYANELVIDSRTGWIGKPQLKIGALRSTKVIPVVAYGNHFELLTSQTETTDALYIPEEILQKDNKRFNYYSPKKQFHALEYQGLKEYQDLKEFQALEESKELEELVILEEGYYICSKKGVFRSPNIRL